MKKMLTILILAFLSQTYAKDNVCGPDSLICRYEKMYEQYSSMRKVYPDEKSVIRSLLRTYFVGKTLTSQVHYLESVNLAGYDGIILFPTPISKVLYYRETSLSADTVVVVKKVQEKTLALDEQGSDVVQTISYQYSMSKTLGTWKIFQVKQL